MFAVPLHPLNDNVPPWKCFAAVKAFESYGHELVHIYMIICIKSILLGCFFFFYKAPIIYRIILTDIARECGCHCIQLSLLLVYELQADRHVHRLLLSYNV